VTSEVMLRSRRVKAVHGARVKIVGRMERMSLGAGGASLRTGFVATEGPILRSATPQSARPLGDVLRDVPRPDLRELHRPEELRQPLDHRLVRDRRARLPVPPPLALVRPRVGARRAEERLRPRPSPVDLAETLAELVLRVPVADEAVGCLALNGPTGGFVPSSVELPAATGQSLLR
jgi:hypothetical protein